MILLDNVKPEPIFDGKPADPSNIWACNCNFEKGKKYLITAPSGKGKSTLLHLIYGLRSDYSGLLTINEKSTSAFKADEWSDHRQTILSIVFQDLRLFPDLTGLENILLKNNLTKHKSEEEIKTMANQLGIEELLNKKSSTLSYGQRQRVAIIRSLCQPFDYLLLDEPFSHLDEVNIEIATGLIKQEINIQQSALLLVSLGERYDFDYDKKLLL